MTRRQDEAQLAEALVPENHVRLLFVSATSGLTQVTGRIERVTSEVIHLLPHQNGQGQVKTINRDRIHSAVVTRMGGFTARRRAVAGRHLHQAAGLVEAGDIAKASDVINEAIKLVPGLKEGLR